MILGKLAVLESKAISAQAPQTFGRRFGTSMAPGQLPLPLSFSGQRTVNWMEGLPEDKKARVKTFFEEHAVRLRDKLPPPDPGRGLPDREAVSEAVEESDLILKQELKAILNQDEYQRFLDAHPKANMQFSKPPSIQ